jgi:gliding motility-associated-like protein
LALYTLTVTNPADGCSGQAQVTVSANTSLPDINAGADQQLTCANTTATLSGSSSTPGASFSWSGPGIVSGGSTATAVVNQAGQYTLTVTDASSGCQATETVDVSQNNTIPDVSIAPPAGLDCSTTQITLQGNSATGGVQFQWAGPSVVSGGSTAQATINQPGLYTLTVTNPANSCQNSASVTVTQSGDLPDVNIAPPSLITCSTTQVSLNAGSSIPGVTYTWSGPGIVSGGGTASPTVNAAGTYSVNVFNPANNCTATETVTVSQDISTPNIQIISGNEINCVESEVVLSVTSDPVNVIRQWSGPGIVGSSTGADVVVNTAGTYSVTVTRSDNGCSASASVDVIENTAVPNVQIGSPDELTCVTAEVVLSGQSATPGVSFSWNGPGIVSGGSSSAPTVNQPGTYTLTVSDPTNGCSNAVDVLVSENTTPPDVSAGSDAQLSCTDPSITLSGSSSTPGAQFSWTGPGIVGGSSASAVEVNQEGTYVLTVTNPANGCTASDNALVTENAASPVLSIATPSELNCLVSEISLEGSSSVQNAVVAWTGPGLSGPSDVLITTATAPGTYILSVLDISNGCESTESVVVTQNITLPDVNAGTAADLTCQSPTISLSGSSTVSGAEYSWSGPGILSGGNTATPQVNTQGTYVLTITNPANGCESSASVVVNGSAVVPDIIAGDDQEITCAVPTVQAEVISNTPGVTFEWAGAGILSGGNSAAATVNQAGIYTVTVTETATGCFSTASVEVTANTSPPELSLPSTAVINCSNPEINVLASSSTLGVTYGWTGPGIVGANDQPGILLDAAGTYNVVVFNPQNGCQNSASITVSEDFVAPDVSAGEDVILNCGSGTASLTGISSVTGVSFSWSGPGIVSGQTSSQAVVNAGGTYTLTVINPNNGCSAQDEASAVAADPVVVTAEVFENPCQQLNEGAVILDIEGGVEPYTVAWSNGASGSNLSGVSGGTYTAVVTDLSGCEVEASYTVPEGIFLVEALSDASISLGDSVDLSGIVTGGSGEVLVVWTPADYLSCQACLETNAKPFQDIFYVFTATDTSGCIASDTVFIDVDTQYDLYFPSAFTPNSDGLNDRFRALGSIDIVTDFQLQIFNRWGELVFETNDITGAWDGTFKGERVPTDGFIHSAKARFIDGNERSYSGVVVVLQ